MQPTKICLPVPLYHCFGMVMGSLQSIAHGATCIFPCPGFDAKTTLLTIQEERCVHYPIYSFMCIFTNTNIY